MELFKKNFGLTSWIVRIAFVITHIFANWFTLKSTVMAVIPMLTTSSLISRSIWGVIIVGIISALISLLIVRVLTIFVLNYSRIFYLPPTELVVVVTGFVALRNLAVGLLCLTYLITPVVTAWGNILFSVLPTLAVTVLFYFYIKKHYLNAGNDWYFFKTISSLTLIYSALTILGGLL